MVPRCSRQDGHQAGHHDKQTSGGIDGHPIHKNGTNRRGGPNVSMGTAFGSLELRCCPALVSSSHSSSCSAHRRAQQFCGILRIVPWQGYPLYPSKCWAILMGRVSPCSFDWQLPQLAHQHRNRGHAYDQGSQTESPGVRHACHAAGHGTDEAGHQAARADLYLQAQKQDPTQSLAV